MSTELHSSKTGQSQVRRKAETYPITETRPKTEAHQITVQSLTVDVARKAIKNLHLGVYPPDGRVRVAAPLAVSDEAVRLAVIEKLGWIKRQQSKFADQPRQGKREMVSGESHYFLGQRYRLRVVNHEGPARVICGKSHLELHVRPELDAEQRERVLTGWYREQLKQLIPPVLAQWEPKLGVQATNWGIRKMKTRWGTCNREARRIWLNLELAKKPKGCLEYVVIHELVHLLERDHNDRFRSLMDQFMPRWQIRRTILNQAPLGHEDWVY